MSFDVVWADLKDIYQVSSNQWPFFTARLTEADVQRWSACMGVSRAALYDQIAIHLARGFHTSELDFMFCDAIVNDIHGVITHSLEDRPDLFWRVFLAFDAGEFLPKGQQGNPIDTYTRPQIAQIVESH